MKMTIKKNRTFKIITAIALLFLSLSNKSFAQQEKLKRYKIEAAEVKYKTKSPMGEGEKTLKFDNYGNREVTHEIIKRDGEIVKNNLVILNHGTAYNIDLLKKTGEDMSEQIKTTMKMIDSDDEDFITTGKKMLQDMGGKKIGSETFLGKNCEVWEIDMMGKTKLLIWNGLTLKMEAKIMGVTTSEKAQSINTKISFNDSDFEVPKGIKITTASSKFDELNNNDENEEMTPSDKQRFENMMNMSYPEFKNMMKQQSPGLTDKEIKQAYDMMKKMGELYKNK
jgi:hypothetical protein